MPRIPAPIRPMLPTWARIPAPESAALEAEAAAEEPAAEAEEATAEADDRTEEAAPVALAMAEL